MSRKKQSKKKEKYNIWKDPWFEDWITQAFQDSDWTLDEMAIMIYGSKKNAIKEWMNLKKELRDDE